jgi:anti-sigma regulatory factor (Ser/Thr protein kinase)
MLDGTQLEDGQAPGFHPRTRRPSEGALPAPSGVADEIAFTIDLLSEVRRFVSAHAERAGLIGQRAADAILASNELATNSVRHGGGDGILRVWEEETALVCEVRDAGQITDPLAGRRRPTPEQTSGRGLWIVNQLCDTVQIRSSPAGTVIRTRIGLS